MNFGRETTLIPITKKRGVGEENSDLTAHNGNGRITPVFAWVPEGLSGRTINVRASYGSLVR
jgi:hypothetical protein